MARLDKWLTEYVNVKSCPVVDMIGRQFLISQMARVYQPGCKVDTSLMLYQGAGGAGKSGLCKLLAMDDRYFVGLSTNIGNDVKAAQEKIVGKWIVEIPEMVSFAKASVGAMKDFLTIEKDEYRAAYGRLTNVYPRQCVMIATTNRRELPNDQAAQRRFLPVEVNSIYDDPQDKKERKIKFAELKRDRDQLFAEAVAAYKAGELWYMLEGDPRERLLDEYRQDFVEISSDDDLIQSLLDNDWAAKDFISNADLFEAFEIRNNDSNKGQRERAVKDAMGRVKGWTSGRNSKGDKRGWKRLSPAKNELGLDDDAALFSDLR